MQGHTYIVDTPCTHAHVLPRPTYRNKVMLLLNHAAEPLAQIFRGLGVPDIPRAAHDVKGAMHSFTNVIYLHLDLRLKPKHTSLIDLMTEAIYEY